MEEKREFLGDTPSHVTLILGVLVGVVGTVLVVYLFGSPSSSANKEANTNVAAGQPSVPNVPTPTQPTAAPTANVEITDQDYIRGNVNAPIDLVEYSDFECPFCARHTSTIEQVLSEYDGQVRFVYRHFPLNSLHPNAQKAAEASECAGEQGKFWEMHDELFALSSQGTMSTDAFKQSAANMGLNTDQFNECLDSGKMAGKVSSQAQQGASYGVTGTPGTFVNGKLVSGAVPFQQIKALIDAELANLK